MQGTFTSSFGVGARVNHDASKFYHSRLYSELGEGEKVDKRTTPFPPELLDTIINGTSEDMSIIPDNSLHLMVTSPPYNVSKEYDNDLSLKEYLDLLHRVFSEVYRVLVNGGRAFVNVANLGRKPYIPLSSYVVDMMQEIGYNMRGEIIWNKGSSASSSCAWGSWQSASNPTLRDAHEYILVFSKGDYRRERTKAERETKRDTITKDDFIEWTRSIWTMKAESARRIGHPAPFPEELPRWLIQLYSFTDDIVLDPFMGSGTTAVAAVKNGRRYVGFDVSAEYVALAQGQIKATKEEVAAPLFD